jgi:hypothetical protein
MRTSDGRFILLDAAAARVTARAALVFGQAVAILYQKARSRPASAN